MTEEDGLLTTSSRLTDDQGDLAGEAQIRYFQNASRLEIAKANVGSSGTALAIGIVPFASAIRKCDAVWMNFLQGSNPPGRYAKVKAGKRTLCALKIFEERRRKNAGLVAFLYGADRGLGISKHLSKIGIGVEEALLTTSTVEDAVTLLTEKGYYELARESAERRRKTKTEIAFKQSSAAGVATAERESPQLADEPSNLGESGFVTRLVKLPEGLARGLETGTLGNVRTTITVIRDKMGHLGFEAREEDSNEPRLAESAVVSSNSIGPLQRLTSSHVETPGTSFEQEDQAEVYRDDLSTSILGGNGIEKRATPPLCFEDDIAPPPPAPRRQSDVRTRPTSSRSLAGR